MQLISTNLTMGDLVYTDSTDSNEVATANSV